jgi:hypothetical protein
LNHQPATFGKRFLVCQVQNIPGIQDKSLNSFRKETGILPLRLQSMNSPLFFCDERRPEEKKKESRVAISSGRTDSDRERLEKYWKTPKDQSNYR